jgi:alkanesulfonate monooxygenase SsuD/methylene tetrahydromethanopterin reductase-like flavin-dependent oxidoreductase (luciferase family)
MTDASTAERGGQIRSLSFLSPGNFRDNNPAEGLEDTLSLFELGEHLGFDGAWIRQRHLEHGVASAAVFLAAASQRTRSIQLGTAVIPMGYESPFRLGEESRYERTRAPQGERGVLFAPDLVGPSEQIVERLRADAAVQRVSELRIELPYEFASDDYVQILHDVASNIAPRLGWRPAVSETSAA